MVWLSIKGFNPGCCTALVFHGPPLGCDTGLRGMRAGPSAYTGRRQPLAAHLVCRSQPLPHFLQRVRRFLLSASCDSLAEKLWRTALSTKSLRQRFCATSSHTETVGMTSVEKKGNIDKTFMEVQHRPVFKSSLCPTATSTWTKGV